MKNKLKTGFIVILYGPVFVCLANIWIRFSDIEKNKPVNEMSEAELWGYIGALAVISGIAVAITIGVANIFIFIYKKLTDHRGDDYF